MTALLLMSPWSGAAHAALGCAGTSSIDIARQAFVEQDEPVFGAAFQETTFRLSCLREPLNDRDTALIPLVNGHRPEPDDRRRGRPGRGWTDVRVVSWW